MILDHERLRDRIEQILPEREDFALSATELAIWTGSSQESAQKACRALQRFGAVGMKLHSIKTNPKGHVTTRTIWWRTA